MSARQAQAQQRTRIVDTLLDALAAVPEWDEEPAYHAGVEETRVWPAPHPEVERRTRAAGDHRTADVLARRAAFEAELRALRSRRSRSVAEHRTRLSAELRSHVEWLRAQDQLLGDAELRLIGCCEARDLQSLLLCTPLCTRCREAAAERLLAIRRRMTPDEVQRGDVGRTRRATAQTPGNGRDWCAVDTTEKAEIAHEIETTGDPMELIAKRHGVHKQRLYEDALIKQSIAMRNDHARLMRESRDAAVRNQPRDRRRNRRQG